MQIKIFCVHDSKAEAFMNPFYSPTAGTAIRMFTASANNPEHEFGKYSEDYTLFELGSWDEDNATFDLHETPRSLGLALQYKEGNLMGAAVQTTEDLQDERRHPLTGLTAPKF